MTAQTAHKCHFGDKEMAEVQVDCECSRFATGDIIVIFKGNSELHLMISGFDEAHASRNSARVLHLVLLVLERKFSPKI